MVAHKGCGIASRGGNGRGEVRETVETRILHYKKSRVFRL
jgi:hypothetical protein